MNPTEQQEIAEAKSRRGEVSFERLERWVLAEFCRIMRQPVRGSEPDNEKADALWELHLRAAQLLKERDSLR